MFTSRMIDVVGALAVCPKGSKADDLPLPASVQSISNSLRHARRYGWVTSMKPNPKVNSSIWRITRAGRAALKQLSDTHRPEGS